MCIRDSFELIAVLIRPSTKRFASVCGETRAQSIHADRAYLACYLGGEEFTEEQIETALHLGIGLLRIDSDRRCRRLVPAPLNRPSRGMRASLLHHLGLVICQLCGVSFRYFQIISKMTQCYGTNVGLTDSVVSAMKVFTIVGTCVPTVWEISANSRPATTSFSWRNAPTTRNGRIQPAAMTSLGSLMSAVKRMPS